MSEVDELTEAAPCDLDANWPGSREQPMADVACGEPSIGTAVSACLHEHVDRTPLCAGCAVDIQQAAGTLMCPHCWMGGERHDCYLLIVIEWDSGEKTIVQAAH
jgi:hypothetical protein